MKYIDNRLKAKIVKLEDANNNYTSEDVEGALEEIDSKIKTIEANGYDDTKIKQEINNIKNEIGSATLNTDAINIKGAVNELNSKIEINKTNVEGALEEVNSRINGLNNYDDTQIRQDINNIKNEIGTEELTTTDQTIKGAVNEIDSKIKNNEYEINILKRGMVNVLNFGAIGDGVNDDTNSIKSAIQYCVEKEINDLFFPAGIYKITSNLNLPRGVNLIGVYEHSTFQVEFDETYAITLNDRHRLENLSFYYPANDPSSTSTPKQFPAAIYAKDMGYSVLRNIGLGNAYKGMYLENIGGGSLIENIYGYPLNIGIEIGHCLDVTPISRIHFNPNFFGVPNLKLRKYVFENAIALKIGRYDFGNIDKAFAWGYKFLVCLTDSPKGGSANNIKFTNWIADACNSLCLFEHHDSGISFINGTGTFYNPFEQEEIDAGLTPSIINGFSCDINNGGDSIWSSKYVSFINNRIYRCDQGFLRAYNPIIFISNEVTGYANAYAETDSSVVDALQLNSGADKSIISGNIINGYNKALNRCVALVNVSNTLVTNNVLSGYKAANVYTNTETNTIINNII